MVEQDSTRDTNKLIFKGDGEKIDFERLAKRMPNAVQQLKAGEISADDLAEKLADIYTRKITSERKDCKRPGEFCLLITQMAWPRSPEYATETDQKNIIEFYNDFSTKHLKESETFLRSQESRGKSYDDIWAAHYGWAVKNLQTVFESTCRAWSKRLDRKYFHGKTGAFLRSCRIYGLSQQKHIFKERYETDTENYRKHRIRAKKVKQDARRAALVFQSGADEVWSHCWQCGEKVADLKVCSRCSVARYCGRECQLTAWSGGHKQVCSKYKLYYETMLENLRIADEVHEAGTIHGFQPNESFDHGMIIAINQLKVTGAAMNYELSLACFYKNVGHIIRGDWWIYSEPDTLEEFKEKMLRKDEFERQSILMHHLCLIGQVLCIDPRRRGIPQRWKCEF